MKRLPIIIGVTLWFVFPSVGVITRVLFENHYLDVEELYRQEGWLVTHDKPGYDETYPATFTFERSP